MEQKLNAPEEEGLKERPLLCC